MIANVLPAILIDPLRDPPGFVATVYVTVPLPLPLPPAVTTIHESWLVAVQEQPTSVVTATVPEPPLFGNV